MTALPDLRIVLPMDMTVFGQVTDQLSRRWPDATIVNGGRTLDITLGAPGGVDTVDATDDNDEGDEFALTLNYLAHDMLTAGVDDPDLANKIGQFFLASFKAVLDQHDAPNHLTLSYATADDDAAYSVTVQRPGRQLEAQLAEAKARIAELEARLA